MPDRDSPSADDIDFGVTLRGFRPNQLVFQRYTLMRILGRGGMGIVWLARDEKLEREVALKFLPEMVSMDAEAVTDLKRETRRSLDLTHPRIVRIYDFLDAAHTAAISMEYVKGSHLGQLKLEEPAGYFEVPAIEKWAQQLCEALTYAHREAGVVHRDLKPANLMVDARGDLKVTDFGIAANITDSVSRVSKAAGSSGTPLYMSPQQMMGENPAATDDVYALGATLYELLAGKPPFFSGNVMMQVMNKPAPSVGERRAQMAADAGREVLPLPAPWEETIAACLAKDPADRPQSADEVWGRLDGRGARGPISGSLSRGGGSMREEGGVKSEPASMPRAGRSPPATASWRYDTAKGESGVEGEDMTATHSTIRYSRASVPQGKSSAGRWLGLALGLVLVVGVSAWWWHQQQTESDPTAEQAALAALRFDVEIKTTPPGAEVILKGIRRISPTRFGDLPAGDHEVTVAKPGYSLHTSRFTIPQGGPAPDLLPINLQLRKSSMVIGAGVGDETHTLRSVKLSAPDQAPVELAGPLPQMWDQLPEGEYAVTFHRNGWPPVERRVIVAPGQVARVEPPVFAPARLAANSVPQGAAFAVFDGRGQEVRSGVTPMQAELPPGNYRLVLRRAGWPDVTRHVSLIEGKTETVEEQFRRVDAMLTSAPSSAEVWRAGQHLGTTPLRLDAALDPGPVQFELRLAGYQPGVVGGVAVPGERLNLNLDLTPLARPVQSPSRASTPEHSSGSAMDDFYTLADLTEAPVPTFRVNPIYPFEMRRRGVTGEVLVEFIVATDGTVRSAHVIETTHEAFNQAALTAVGQWKFRPGRLDGRAVNTKVRTPIVFRLGG